MSKEIFLKQNDLRLLYFRYKDSPYYILLLISVVFFVCMILFFQLVVPQIQNWFSIRGQVIAARERIDTINKNITFMNTIDEQLLNEQVQVTTSALPFEKDFGGILNALTDASTRAGVALDDYSFQIGNIASTSGQQAKLANNLSSVKVTITISGSIDRVSNFLDEINQKLPLSEVIDVDGQLDSTTITFLFYQKQFPQIVFKDDQPLTVLSAKEQVLFDNLSSWLPALEPQDIEEDASSSGVPLF